MDRQDAAHSDHAHAGDAHSGDARKSAARADEARAAWRRLIAAVEAVSTEFGITTLCQVRRETQAVGFPVDGESARLAASALITLADAYPTAAIESRRYHIGQALTAAARCVGGLLDEHHQAAADLARLRMGERD